MDDIALLADRLLLMSHGTIAYDGTVDHFMSLTPTTKRLVADFTIPLSQELIISSSLKIPMGSLSFDHSLSSIELFNALKIITTQASSAIRKHKLAF